MLPYIPVGATVLEFGAGQQSLRALLPQDCRYIPSDIVARTPDTVVCDLNERPLPDLRSHQADITVLSGVLEYVHDVGGLASWLVGAGPRCLVSYSPAKVRFPGERALKMMLRAENGWVNAFTRGEILDMFKKAGFIGGPVAEWHSHVVFLFER